MLKKFVKLASTFGDGTIIKEEFRPS